MPFEPSSDLRVSSEQHRRRHSIDSVNSIGTSSKIDSPRLPIHQYYSAKEFLNLPSENEESQDRMSVLSNTLAPPEHHGNSRHKRFSLVKLRYASDSQLSSKARLHAQLKVAPPIPQVPDQNSLASLETTVVQKPKKKYRLKKLTRSSRVSSESQSRKDHSAIEVDASDVESRKVSTSDTNRPDTRSRITFGTADATVPPLITGPPPYGDDISSSLALPVNRLSDSSRSDVSSGDHGVYGTTTTTTHTVQTTTVFFRLPRRRKPAPLFDLPHLTQKANSQPAPNLTVPARSSRVSVLEASIPNVLDSPSRDSVSEHGKSAPPSPFKTSRLSPSKSGISRHRSQASIRSSPVRTKGTLRHRSSTLNSIPDIPTEDQLPQAFQSTRTSSSGGRKSLGDFFGLGHKPEPPCPQYFSGSTTTGTCNSKANSMQLNREEPFVLPERLEDEPPAKYLIRLEEAVSRGVVASVLSRGTDPFSKAVLRSYMRGFGFFGDPMDIAIRKLLMEVELPRETQQIDRCLQGFANRYHECNPGIYASPDQAYFIAFSLLILNTDVFNKNNKHKMQKSDYLKNTGGQGVFNEILGCFYDNITYTQFIHVEDDLDINGERIISHKLKKRHKFSGNIDATKRPSRESVDPYALIIDGKLDTLRPNLKDLMYLEEHYSYLGTAPSLNLSDLQKTFFKTGILQIVSARSRPDAFMSDRTVRNPDEAEAGIVDIKITKVGLLWRKDPRKKKTRSPWQEWGAILTGAQLYFFRNTAWIKSLMHQLETHIKQGNDGTPVIFKPPLEQFKPDALISTDDSVALLDTKYKKHKNAFVHVRHAGLEETFLADSEEEMNDWLAKLNYAAAFRTSGVRMRGVVGDGQRSRGIRRATNPAEPISLCTALEGDTPPITSKVDHKMAQDILSARREIMLQKIADADAKLSVAQKQLELLLRNARHLQILTPIQPKTRENILSATGKISAQLKWERIRIWRLRCHKDILTMDLEEEAKTSGNICHDKTDACDTPILEHTTEPSGIY